MYLLYEANLCFFFSYIKNRQRKAFFSMSHHHTLCSANRFKIIHVVFTVLQMCSRFTEETVTIATEDSSWCQKKIIRMCFFLGLFCFGVKGSNWACACVLVSYFWDTSEIGSKEDWLDLISTSGLASLIMGVKETEDVWTIQHK